MTNETVKGQLNAAIMATKAMAEAIRELKQVPSGVLYAQLMGVMDLGQYEAILGILIRAGLVRKEASHMLVWTGGQPI